MSMASRTLSSSVLRISRCPRIKRFKSCRSVHSIPNFAYPIDRGLGDFLSPAALHTIAVEYQGGLLARLNELVAGTRLEHESVVQTVISSATDADLALTFNVASQALNNSFFLDNLKPPPAEPLLDEDDKSIIGHENFLASSLKTEIVANFGSVDQLKSTVSAAAMGMMGSGWIWVVMDQQRHMGVVPTYGAGTLLVRSRLQRTPRSYVIGARSKSRADHYNPTLSRRSSSPGSSTLVLPNDSSSSTTSSHPLAKNTPPSRNPPDSTRSYSTQTGPKTIISRSRSTVADARDTYESGSTILSSSTASNPYGRNTTMISPNYALKNLFLVGAQLSPLFCVSVHEHAWILDYGVQGKQEYLARFWNALDWERVVENFEYFTRRP